MPVFDGYSVARNSIPQNLTAGYAALLAAERRDAAGDPSLARAGGVSF
jgi:hypothetical protein